MEKYDVIIIGAGPAGTAAAVYAARKQLKTLIVTESFGGQSIVSETIFNWIGTPEISGSDLAKSFESHVRYYEGEFLTIKVGSLASQIEERDGGFDVKIGDENFWSKTILVCTGSSRRKLDVPGAEKYEHKGITYCASCDGPIFKDQDVVVIGGGNAGFESAAQLLAYTKSVTLLNRSPNYKADPITVKKVLSHEKMTGLTDATITEVFGETMVAGIKYKDKEGTEHTINATGVFAEIGQIPNTDFVNDLVDLNLYNQIITDPKNQRTSHANVWAAGDCTDVMYHQNNISAGDAVLALEDIYQSIHAR